MFFRKSGTNYFLIAIVVILFGYTVSASSIESITQSENPEAAKCRSTTRITDIILSPVDQTFVTNWNEGGARLWDMNTGKVIQEFLPESNVSSFSHVAFSPQGNMIALGNSTEITLWDVKANRKLRTFRRNIDDTFGTNVSFSSDGRWLFTSGYDGASLWDVNTGEKLQTFPGQQAIDISQYGHLSSDDQYVLTTDGFQVNIWDALTGKKLHTFEQSVYGMFTPDAQSVFTWRLDYPSASNMLVLSDLTTFQEKSTFETYSAFLKFSKDSRYFLESGDPVRLWDLTTGKILLSIPYGYVIDFFPDNHSVLVPYSSTNTSSGRDNTLQIWDIDQQKTVQQIPLPEGEVANYQITRDGNSIIYVNWSSELHLWDVDKAARTLQFC